MRKITTTTSIAVLFALLLSGMLVGSLVLKGRSKSKSGTPAQSSIKAGIDRSDTVQSRQSSQMTLAEIERLLDDAGLSASDVSDAAEQVVLATRAYVGRDASAFYEMLAAAGFHPEDDWRGKLGEESWKIVTSSFAEFDAGVPEASVGRPGVDSPNVNHEPLGVGWGVSSNEIRTPRGDGDIADVEQQADLWVDVRIPGKITFYGTETSVRGFLVLRVAKAKHDGSWKIVRLSALRPPGAQPDAPVLLPPLR